MSNRLLGRILLVVSLTICFIADTRVYINISENVSYAILLFWIIFAAVNFEISSHKVKDENKAVCLSIWMKYSMIPKIVIYTYTLFLIISGLTERRYLTTNLKTFINGMAAICIFYLFGKASFFCSCYAVVAAYALEIIVKICTVGLRNGSLEFHDIAFSAGYVFIYVFFVKTGWTFKELVVALFALIATALAGKRIGIVALGIVFLWIMLGRVIKNEKIKRTYILISGLILIILCEFFIWFVLNFDLLKIAKMTTINFSGRDYYYSVMQNYADYKVNFIGLGRNAVQVIMTQDFPWLRVGNVHSDVLRMYIECGFVLFLLWMITYVIVMPINVRKLINIKASEFVFICTLYTFIVYLTDNTELYLMNQYFYILTTIFYMNNEKEIIYTNINRKLNFNREKQKNEKNICGESGLL